MTMMALAEIKKQISSTDVIAKISNSLGKPATDPSVMKFINGAIMYMQSKVGQKGDVSHCTRQSIVDSLICAATLRLPVDNRHLACLIAYKDVCNFQPEWRGYVYKVKEADPSAEITTNLVFKGDLFVPHREGNNASYTHTIANPFNDKEQDIIGAYTFIKTDTGSSIDFMSKKELDAARNSSKAAFDFMWKAWPSEMYKKTMTRRACKMRFMEAVAALDALDNRLFNEGPARPAAAKIAKSIPLPPVQEAEVVDGEEEGKGEISEEEMKAKTEEARRRKEQMEAEEKAQREAEAEAAAKAAAGNKKNPPESSEELTAEGTVKAIIAPKGNSPYTKFTLREVDGKFFATKDAATIEMLEAAKKSGARVKITYTETAWSGGLNQNITKAEVLSGVSEELPY